MPLEKCEYLSNLLILSFYKLMVKNNNFTLIVSEISKFHEFSPFLLTFLCQRPL